MLAGPLDSRVEWQTATDAPDRLGNAVRTWSTSFTTWCCVARLSAAEQIQALETVDEKTVKLQIRWREGVNAGPNSRFVFDGLTYRVQGVTPIGRREGLEITGKTRADGGGMPT